ncbi:MAG: CvpA family protein [Chloroflexota bacterium]|nr:CvpA family protein [Chloroflexota bacterium]MDH5244155.1 CvpA family protein [Chloroflexota bacterium]
MDFGDSLGGIQTVDLLLILYFMAFFVLGYAQGTIRRLIGIGTILFSFFLAANLAEPLGNYLGGNWTQFSREYSYMIAFLSVFVASALAFAIIAQGFYKPQPLFEKARFIDEVLGGVLGVVQAGLILAFVVVILGTFFLLRGIAPDPDEIPFLRSLWEALDQSRIVDVFRDTLIPLFFALTGFLVPDSIEILFPSPA